MQTRPVPFSVESEMSVLGGILLENGAAIHQVLEIVKPEDFHLENHRKILGAIMELTTKSEPADLVTMINLLKKQGELEAVGGAAYLATLLDYVPTSANIAFYCRTVKEKAFNRRVIANAEEIRQAAYDEKDNLGQLVENLLMGMDKKTASSPTIANQLALEATKRLERRHESRGKIQGIPYGFPGLDAATSGMQRGDFIIIAGRPSMGKSALAGNIIENVCQSGYSPMLFSLEMDKAMCTDRLIASAGNVRYENIRSGKFEDADWPRMVKSFSKIASFRLHVDDTPAISLAEIRAKCYRQKKQGLDLVVVDYLQLMDVSTKENRTQALGQISRGLKRLAREMDCPVIALSQLNRAVDGRADKRPTMSDLRDSGEIEQDADVILFPFRPAAYCQDCRDRVNNATHDLQKHQLLAEIIIEKQRNGERNISIPIIWLGKYQRFEEMATDDGRVERPRHAG